MGPARGLWEVVPHSGRLWARSAGDRLRCQSIFLLGAKALGSVLETSISDTEFMAEGPGLQTAVSLATTVCSRGTRPPQASPPVLMATLGSWCTHFTDKETEARGGNHLSTFMRPLGTDQRCKQTLQLVSYSFRSLFSLPFSVSVSHPSPPPLHSSPGILTSSPSPLLFSH